MTSALLPAVGTQAQTQIAEGRLLAFLAYVGYDPAVGTAKYALRVMNNTSAPAAAQLFVEVGGVQRSAYPLPFRVAPYSMHDDIVPVRMDETGPFDRAIVHIFSEETSFTLDAPGPPKGRRWPWQPWAACALAIAVSGAIGFAATPRILAVSVPEKAMAGTTVDVPFQVSGAGTIEYDFATRDGLRLAAGLASRSDVLKLPIPVAGSGAPYELHLHMRNALMSADRSATISAVVAGGIPQPVSRPAPRKAAPKAPASLISDLTVTPSTVTAGGMISVKYATRASQGDVWLLGLDGKTWARAPLSVAGITQLSVPQAAAGHDMRVVLHATSGGATAQSSVGVSVLPSRTVANAAPAAPAGRPVKSLTPSLALDSQVVSPGDSVVVRVSGMRGDVKITLMSASGTTVEQGSVSDEDGAISLTAPSVNAVTTYYVVGTFQSGASEQSVLRRLVVTPR